MNDEFCEGGWDDAPKENQHLRNLKKQLEDLDGDFSFRKVMPWINKRHKVNELKHKIKNHKKLFPEEYV